MATPVFYGTILLVFLIMQFASAGAEIVQTDEEGRFEARVPRDLAVRADYARLEQIVVNLVSNALNFFAGNTGELREAFPAGAVTEVSLPADVAMYFLRAPDGTQLGSNWGTVGAQINIADAPASGTYTVLVGTNDSGNNGTGTYTVTVNVTATRRTLLRRKADSRETTESSCPWPLRWSQRMARRVRESSTTTARKARIRSRTSDIFTCCSIVAMPATNPPGTVSATLARIDGTSHRFRCSSFPNR